ncbi:uncharacterized protein LOC111698356 isoform X2 [Eurytemora carolleeae]|nr:uncharacterized protein LOC111698356 isoform X2 [Eurytemora carolleeae]|eukprot:XP_023324440.1 uncharacterized protein LOC111698356 isoform X2 [Eurytemora affinis]
MYKDTSVACFQCSDLEVEVDSQDEIMGPCPGWLRPPVLYPSYSVYDGCISILDRNGSILTQGGILYSLCKQYQNMPGYVQQITGMSGGEVVCCKGEQCITPYHRTAERNEVGELYTKLNTLHTAEHKSGDQVDLQALCSSTHVIRHSFITCIIIIISFFCRLIYI